MVGLGGLDLSEFVGMIGPVFSGFTILITFNVMTCVNFSEQKGMFIHSQSGGHIYTTCKY